MTEEERKHRQRMLDFANLPLESKIEEVINRNKPMTPLELAEAIKELKRKFPQDFPK